MRRPWKISCCPRRTISSRPQDGLRRIDGDSMARVDILMPQMGESIAEGTLSKWLKKLGDEVKRDEPLFEISTDKVDAEIPAPNAGTLVEIKVQEGQTVPVQTLVAVIETDKGASATAAPSAAAQRAPAASGAAVASSPPAPKPAPAPAATSPVPRAPLPAPVRGSRRASGRGSLAGRPRRAVLEDPQDHRGSHDHVAAHLGARDELLRSRLQPGGRTPPQAQGCVRGTRREPHLPCV